MLKLKTSGNVVGDQRTTNRFISNELIDKLDGMLLATAQSKGIIEAMKFEEVTTTYNGNEGSKTFSRIELVTNHGNVIVGEGLGEELASWADRLGDLTFKKGISNRDGKTEFFRLQRPGGGVSVERSDLAIGEQVTAEKAGA